MSSYDMACCQECISLAAACLLLRKGWTRVARAAFQCVWHNKVAQKNAFFCLTSSTHKDLCKSACKTFMFTCSKARESRQAHDTDDEKSLSQLMWLKLYQFSIFSKKYNATVRIGFRFNTALSSIVESWWGWGQGDKVLGAGGGLGIWGKTWGGPRVLQTAVAWPFLECCHPPATETQSG